MQEALEKLTQYEEKESELEEQARLGRAVMTAFNHGFVVRDEQSDHPSKLVFMDYDELIEWAESEDEEDSDDSEDE